MERVNNGTRILEEAVGPTIFKCRVQIVPTLTNLACIKICTYKLLSHFDKVERYAFQKMGANETVRIVLHCPCNCKEDEVIKFTCKCGESVEETECLANTLLTWTYDKINRIQEVTSPITTEIVRWEDCYD